MKKFVNKVFAMCMFLLIIYTGTAYRIGGWEMARFYYLLWSFVCLGYYWIIVFPITILEIKEL